MIFIKRHVQTNTRRPRRRLVSLSHARPLARHAGCRPLEIYPVGLLSLACIACLLACLCIGRAPLESKQARRASSARVPADWTLARVKQHPGRPATPALSTTLHEAYPGRMALM